MKQALVNNMNDETTIKLCIGLGNLKFGSSCDQVEAYLGKPEEITEDGGQGDTTIAWYYWSRHLSAHFDEDDGFKLGIFESSSPLVSLNGKCIISCPKQEILEFLKKENIGKPDNEEIFDLEDDDDSRGCLLSFTSQTISLNLWFEDNALTEIQWDYLIDSKDQVVWP